MVKCDRCKGDYGADCQRVYCPDCMNDTDCEGRCKCDEEDGYWCNKCSNHWAYCECYKDTTTEEPEWHSEDEEE